MTLTKDGITVLNNASVPATMSHIGCTGYFSLPKALITYMPITCVADYLLLQEMIHHIEQWSTENYLNFNSSECKYMVRKRAPLMPDVPYCCLGVP